MLELIPLTIMSIVNEQIYKSLKKKYKKRASHEWKNGEMKHFHGLDRARGYGLKSMSIQAKLTALAVNLKRIAVLVSFCLNYLLYIWANNAFRIIIKSKISIAA